MDPALRIAIEALLEELNRNAASGLFTRQTLLLMLTVERLMPKDR